MVNIAANNNAKPICGIKFRLQISQVFPMAYIKTASANKRLKLASPTKLLLFDIRVASVKLNPIVLSTGYKPKMRKPRIKGVINKYPVYFLLSFIMSPSNDKSID